MKIVGVFHGYKPVHTAGAEMMAHHILRWFAEREHEIVVLTPITMFPLGLTEMNLEGVKVLPFETPDFMDHIRSADILLTHLDMSTRVTKWAKEVGRPCVHIIHNPYSLATWKFKDGDIDLAIFNSEWICKNPQPLQVPSTVVYPPVFKKDYFFKEIDHSRREFVTLINRNTNKGGRFVADITARMPHRFFMLVRGAYPPDDQWCPPHPNVLDQGHTANVRDDVYRRTKILLVPSLMETWGRVAIEALWAGIPVIANSLCAEPGLQESLSDAALWAPRHAPYGTPDDVAEWVKTINLLDNNQELYEQQVQKGYARAEYLERKTVQQLEALEQQFFSILNRSSKSRVNVFAQERHYLEHLTPTLHQVHPENRGLVVVPEPLKIDAIREGHRVISYDPKYALGVNRTVLRYSDPVTSLALVASHTDQAVAEQMGFPAVRQEHGIGQTYEGEANSSYAGSPTHGRLFAYLAPGYHPYLKNKKKYPEKMAHMTGLPLLDRYKEMKEFPNVVGFVFHWDNTVRPETRATWPFWKNAISELSQERSVKLHCHPREKQRFFREFLVPQGLTHLWVETLEELHESVNVVCGDNTSAVFILGALGHPMVLLNAPSYRRSVEHGLRFWDCEDAGPNCEQPTRLVDAIREAETETDLSYRESALNYIFKRRNHASLVQALLLEEWLVFRQKQVDENPYISAEMKRSLDVSGYGPLLKGQTYLLKREDASALIAKGLAITPNLGDIRSYEWPTKYQETNGGIMRPRAIGEKLYRVEEKFRDNGIEYKPGDMVLKREIKPENLQKCKVYEPKTQKPKGMETK